MDPELKFKTFPFELKSAGADGSKFEGLVSVFHNVDSYGEIVDDEAFNEDLPAFMKSGFIGGLNHDWSNPIGTPQAGTRVVDNGLFLVGNVIDTTHGLDVRKMLVAGVVRKLSIGYRTLGHKVLETLEEVKTYWESKNYKPTPQDLARAANGNIWVLTRLKLYEGSPVTVPANDAADITAVKMRAAKAIEDCIGEGCSCNKNGSKPEVDTEQEERLTRIRAIANRKDAEEILCNAGLTQVERKAFISSVKTLLRNVGDETNPPAEPVAEEGTGVDSPPEPTPDASVDTPETTDEPETPDAVEPTGETPEVPAPEAETGKSADAGDHRYRSVDPKDPLGLDLLQLRRDTGTLLYQRFEDLSAQIDRVAIRR